MNKSRLEIFAENLRALRKSQNVTRQYLAEKIGVGVDTIARYERAEREPNLEKLFKLAEALDATISDLIEESPSAEMLKLFLAIADKAHLEPKQLEDGTISIIIPPSIINVDEHTLRFEAGKAILAFGDKSSFCRWIDQAIKDAVFRNKTFNETLYEKSLPLVEK